MSKSKSHKWQRACRMFPTYAGTERRDTIAASAYVPEPLTRLVTSKPRGTYQSAGFASSATPTPVVQPVAPKLAQPGLRLLISDLVADALVDRLLTPGTCADPERGFQQTPLLRIFLEGTYNILDGALSRRDILEIVDQMVGLYCNERTIKALDVPKWNAAINAEHRRLNALGAMYAQRRATQAQGERRGHKPKGSTAPSGVSNPAAYYAEMPRNKAQFKSRMMRKGE